MSINPSSRGDDTSDRSELVKSRKRVADHGEVFTPQWLVEEMLDLVKGESERIDSRFLEPACGSGNFLKPVLHRKLAVVQSRYGRSEFERKHYALFALMCVYGIELLADNVAECRQNLQNMFDEFLGIDHQSGFSRAATSVLHANIVQGNALTLQTPNGDPITFSEWGYLGTGKYQRRDFCYGLLTQRSSVGKPLFTMQNEQSAFVPTKTYKPLTVEVLAQ